MASGLIAATQADPNVHESGQCYVVYGGSAVPTSVELSGLNGPNGFRVNGISAGPIKTLAAAGIGGFSKIQHFVEKNAPLRRNVTADEVGNVAAFLLSDLASGITSEISYVDAGFSHVMGGAPRE